MKIIICNSLWLTYEWDHSSDTALSTHMPILRYCKDFTNFLFCKPLAWLAMATKKDGISLERTCYFGYLGHIWPHPPKTKVSTYKKQCISTFKKSTWSLFSFLRYYILNNPAIWFIKDILVQNMITRIFQDQGLVVNYK